MKSWREVEGFFDYPYLYDNVIGASQPGDVIVEIGSWMGQSMAYLAQGLQAKGWTGSLFSVDTFTGELNQPAHQPIVSAAGGSIRHLFDANMRECGVSDLVHVMQCDSAQAASNLPDGSVSFCFIDAAHDYASVMRDILAWVPKMKPGGMLAGHDYHDRDVHTAVAECFAGTGYMVAGSCWIKHMPTNMTPSDWHDAIKRGEVITRSRFPDHPLAPSEKK